MSKEFRKIDEFIGARMTLMPLALTDRYPTRFGETPCLITEVVVHWPSEDQDLGTVYVFNKSLIAKVKEHWTGRPIEGTLRQRRDPRHRDLAVLTLEEVEIQ